MKVTYLILAGAWLAALPILPVHAEEKVAYLGVATAAIDESLKSQLGLSNGITVVDVRDEGPSAGILQKHDILTKLDDQILFNPDQLTTLVGSKKKGDRVTFALVRNGASQTVSVNLGEREEKDTGGGPALKGGQGLTIDQLITNLPEALPAEARKAIDEALKKAGAGGPGGARADGSVRVIINGKEVVIPGLGDVHLDPSLNDDFKQTQTSVQSSSSTMWSDGKRTYQIARHNGKTTVKVTEDGKTLCEGPFDSNADQNKIPQDLREKLKEIEAKVHISTDNDKKQKPQVQ